MSEFKVFMLSLIDHWVSWGTSSLLALITAILDRLCHWKLPKLVYGAFLAVGFFVACFLAWRHEYRENSIGREAGSLAFVQLGGDFNRHGRLADPQVEIVLKNLQPRLLKYQIDHMKLTIESREAPPIFANRGGYVYGGQLTTFRASTLKGLELSREPLSGVLEYSITYNFVGSKAIHHSRKKLAFDLYYSRALSGRYTTLDENED
jgi:hypothetical protein